MSSQFIQFTQVPQQMDNGIPSRRGGKSFSPCLQWWDRAELPNSPSVPRPQRRDGAFASVEAAQERTTSRPVALRSKNSQMGNPWKPQPMELSLFQGCPLKTPGLRVSLRRLPSRPAERGTAPNGRDAPGGHSC